MFVSFNEISSEARVWIYQSNIQLTDSQIVTIENYLKPAIEKWSAHGTGLFASAKVFNHRFVIIALDESKYPASGCSIDASTHWFNELGARLNLDFFDRSLAYLEKEEIKTVSAFQIKQAIQNGIISASTMVFQNTVETVVDLSENWKVKASETYLKRYFV